MAKKGVIGKKKQPPTPSESEGEDFDDYDEEDDNGSIEDIGGRIRNDSGSDDEQG